MPFAATIEVNDQGLKEMLFRAQEKLRDLTPVMREISEIMIEASMRAFAEKKDPETGAPWAELAEATKKYRKKHGRADQNILQFSGLMRASIGRPGRGILKIGPFEALVGTNVPYAAVHQFGAEITHNARPVDVRLRKVKGKTLFARKSHKRVWNVHSIAWAHTVKIPARPFLGVDDSDIEKMKNAIKRYLLD